jgi:hypothetical protein
VYAPLPKLAMVSEVGVPVYAHAPLPKLAMVSEAGVLVSAHAPLPELATVPEAGSPVCAQKDRDRGLKFYALASPALVLWMVLALRWSPGLALVL